MKFVRRVHGIDGAGYLVLAVLWVLAVGDDVHAS